MRLLFKIYILTMLCWLAASQHEPGLWLLLVPVSLGILFLESESYIRVASKTTLQRGTRLSAGIDLKAAEAVTIRAGERALIDVGVRVQLPTNYYGQLASRSSLAVKGLDVCAGVIDNDYRGPIKVLIHNTSDSDYEVEASERIAQLIPIRYCSAPLIRQDALSVTGRGDGGFGSTN